MITGIKDVSKLRVGDTLTVARAPGRRGAARLPGGEADGLLRPLPDRHRPLRGPPRRARAPVAERRRALLGAGDLAGARLRLSLRLPRPPAHGHRPRAARARVRPRAAGDDAERPLRGHAPLRRAGRGPQPDRHARPGRDRGDRRALHPRDADRADRARRRGHGALPGPARHPRRPPLPLARARPASLRPAARRDRPRLLRPAQVADRRATPRSTTSRSATRSPTWSSSTSCSPATGSTRCR